jgi:hypothetical protein
MHNDPHDVAERSRLARRFRHRCSRLIGSSVVSRTSERQTIVAPECRGDEPRTQPIGKEAECLSGKKNRPDPPAVPCSNGDIRHSNGYIR